jgi:hypothetical protein
MSFVKFDDIKCRRETKDAILVEIDGREMWVPKSQVHDDSEVYKSGTEGNLIISRWLAEKEGLEDEGEEYE